MKKYTVISFTNFEEEYHQLTEFEKHRVNRIMDQLAEKGSDVGKPLAGHSFFREKKFNGNRLYYLIYEEWKTVLLVDMGPKKVQQKIIAETILRLGEHREYARKILVERGLI